jgi:DNA-binding PadR family transcriptional regulator
VSLKHPRKIYILEDFYDTGSHLFLYEKPGDKERFMASFLERGLDIGERCYHVHPVNAELSNLRRHLGGSGETLVMVPMGGRKLTSLSEGAIMRLRETIETLDEPGGSDGAVRLQLDFGGIPSNGSLKRLLDLERWTHSWGRGRATMSVFDLSILGRKEALELVKIHERVTVSTAKGTTVVFSGKRAPLIRIVSLENMQEWIKKSLDVLVLAMLYQRPMCGIDLIKAISRGFGVEVSQGVMYPILYYLRDRGYLEKVTEPDNKTRIYIPTREGRRFIREKLKAHFLAQTHLLSFITRKK